MIFYSDATINRAIFENFKLKYGAIVSADKRL